MHKRKLHGVEGSPFNEIRHVTLGHLPQAQREGNKKYLFTAKATSNVMDPTLQVVPSEHSKELMVYSPLTMSGRAHPKMCVIIGTIP